MRAFPKRSFHRIFALSLRRVCGLLSVLLLASCDDAPEAAAPSETSSPAEASAAEAATAAAAESTPAMLPQAELAATFNSATALIAEAKTDAVWRKFKVQQQGQMALAGNRLKFTATGGDGALLLPAFAVGRRLVIQAVLDSPVATTAQMFYLTAGQTTYKAAQSQAVPLETGRNVIYFRLDRPNLADPIRFDPGTEAGVYMLESMTARALAPAP